MNAELAEGPGRPPPQELAPAGFPTPEACGIRRTPVLQAARFLPGCQLMVKLEGQNRFGSIKARTAYALLGDLARRGRLIPGTRLVESSSGNLGLALAGLSRELGCRFSCLVDPPPVIPQSKLNQLKAQGVDCFVPPRDGFPDHRAARIAHARLLGQRPDTVWLNQYDNPANAEAHRRWTGPELVEQLGRPPDYLVCSVGTGGTLCGIASHLDALGAATRIVGVEPEGSTIFGGQAASYLSVGAGMSHPSGILRRYWTLLDLYIKVSDARMIEAARRFRALEGEAVGITTGGCLVAAESIALADPGALVAVIAPDGAASYECLSRPWEDDGTPPPTLPGLKPVLKPTRGNAREHADSHR